MRPSRIKAKLSRNEPVMVVTLHLTDPSIFELTSLLGFDGIWMDMEHHPYSLDRAAGLMRAARVGTTDIMARPAKGEFMRMQRMLEAGAHGIMYPRCDDAREAAEVVSWMKFPPAGRRGCDGANCDMPYLLGSLPDYLASANQETFLVVQIEQPETVDHIEEIAAVEGVDVLFIGPGDLSIQYGAPGNFEDSRVQEAIQRVAAAAEKENKHWGIPCDTLARSQAMMDLGARFICHQADILMIKSGLERIRDEFGPVGFSFGP